jgi:two-component system, NtrC family, sensor histidine kinase KinB
MSTEQRTAIVRWLLGGFTLAGSALLWPSLRELSPGGWIVFVSLVALVALIENIGVRVSYGVVTMMPVTALMAYFALGLEPALMVIFIGLVLGGVFQLIMAWRRGIDRIVPWWRRIGRQLWPIARNGLSLIVASLAFNRISATVPPLENVLLREVVLGLLLAPFIYLLIHDLLLIIDLWLRGLPVRPAMAENWRTLLGMQLLPLPIAPFSAIMLTRLGPPLGTPAFVVSEFIVLAAAIVVNRLTIAQDALERQVEQLSSFSTMNETLRTSLDVDSLLTGLYAQVAGLLKVRNFNVMLQDQEPGTVRLAFATENGNRVEREIAGRMDDFTRHVLDQGEPLLADHVETTAQKIGASNPPHARSWMGVPLRASNRMLGVMIAWLGPGDPTDRLFSHNDLILFSAMGLQAGVTLENALLYTAAQQHAAQLARLNEISTVMNASLNPERVLDLIAEAVIAVAGCDKSAIYLLETETRDPALLLTHAQNFSPEHIARSRDIAVLTERERQQVLDEGKAIAVPNVLSDGVLASPVTVLLAQRESFAAYAYLPLSAQKQPIGMLAVYYNKPHRFTQSEIELLETFANQAALAVVNARVYQRVDVQLARRIEQIIKMADINQRLTSTLNLETVFGLIIDSAMEGCEATRGVLVLAGDPEQGQDPGGLNMVAWKGFDPTRSLRMPHHVAEELANSAVIKDGQTVLVSGDDVTITTVGPRSQLSVPIVVEDRVIGAIALESEILNAFNNDDVTFVSQLAVQAAVAIRNAQLYKRAQVVRDRLHAILDASNDGLLMIDAKSRIVMTNARMGDFWDFARDDYGPRSPEQFVADPLTALGEGLGYREGELATMLDGAMRSPNMKMTTDLYATHQQGGKRQRFVERSVAPVHDEEETFLGLLLIFRDVTKQKELEQTREDLTNMIVHDLRSPLQAVMGSMRLINDTVVRKQETDPIIEQATSVSGRAVKKLLNLVNNLLDLSRLDRGEIVLDPSMQPIKPILEDAAAELLPLAQEMDAVIHVEAADDLPETMVDRDMIGRVVLNLVDNALKYSPPGALVTLRADVVSSDQIPGARDSQRKDQMVRIQVSDTGPGVPLEYRSTIFDRYTQVPGTKGRRASAGLGLAFCRLAVESHQGHIWVEANTQAAQGSVFNITLPIARTIGAPERKLAAQPAAEPVIPAAPARPEPDPDDPLATRVDVSVSALKRAAAEAAKADEADPPATEPATPVRAILEAQEQTAHQADDSDPQSDRSPAEKKPGDTNGAPKQSDTTSSD